MWYGTITSRLNIYLCLRFNRVWTTTKLGTESDPVTMLLVPKGQGQAESQSAKISFSMQ